MERYLDLSRSSGVSHYENGNDFIIVQFTDGAQYLYNYSSAGQENIEHMKVLAANGSGLNSFININVKKHYARKIKSKSMFN